MMTRKLLVWVVGIAALAVVTVHPARPQGEPVDLLIRNGRIVDGSGNPWYFGSVAVRGDRIVAVGRLGELPARRVLDAHGWIVAPGFIDLHTHSDYTLLVDGNAESKIRQ